MTIRRNRQLRFYRTCILITLVICMFTAAQAQGQEFRRLPVEEYVDKMKAGWIGQMVGVGWGAPTEFVWTGEIIPEDKVPAWEPHMVNQFNQDDIYVEMTFLRTLELYGLDASIRQAGIDFANSGYDLAHANEHGRANLRKGIAPPDSGHPKFTRHADDIDYQIEADYAGLISPGLPNSGIELGEVFGRLMNYGDGLYGGYFVSGMYAEAFFETDVMKLVEAGLRCVPKGSHYHECITDVIKWYKENPNDWQKTWQLVEEKYNLDPEYRKGSCLKIGGENIDAKINGAYIVMGMLYGEGDLDKTNIISMRCGQDSDCNPSNAAGVLFTSLGLSNLPDRFASELNNEDKFSHTTYNFPMLAEVCEKLARQIVVKQGGRIEKDSEGREVFVIPMQKAKPIALEQCWEPGPIANSRYTAEEMAKIDPPPEEPEPEGVEEPADIDEMNKAISRFAPGWTVKDCGDAMFPGLYEELVGKKNVFVTHPLSQSDACILSREVKIRKKKPVLCLAVGHHKQGDWTLIVKANGKELLKTAVGEDTTKDGWLEVKVDLSEYAGEKAMIDLHNQASEWSNEGGYWTKIGFEAK